jgi:hypothetical protein
MDVQIDNADDNHPLGQLRWGIFHILVGIPVGNDIFVNPNPTLLKITRAFAHSGFSCLSRTVVDIFFYPVALSCWSHGLILN